MRKRKVLPTGIPEETITTVFRKELDRHSNPLIDEIKKFLKQPLLEEITEASAEVFPDQYSDGNTSIGVYLKSGTIQHHSFAGFINDLPYIDIDNYMEDDINIPDMVVDLVKSWFSECWFKAGGWDFPVAIEISEHEGAGNGDTIKLTKSS
ncbi:hypothetical protein MO867_16150 [Microbulbifer sp. OS29]|uniref:Uncharacterized protein n=1 Tax=Microbulbifer okhotskensis TaxID=2926617 RepID=A0A9X2EUR9_9GAMM|nr:hypothetical protein [Microbulbifer okhotskensis]MCO1335868.1 hypothetical protein [Microbulbifer okhotskensis]